MPYISSSQKDKSLPNKNYFIQLDHQLFYAEWLGYKVSLTSDGAKICGPGNENKNFSLLLKALGQTALPVGHKQLNGTINLIRGNNPASWNCGLSIYQEVIYPEVWRGIDLIFKLRAQGLKYEFVVRPGASPSSIKLCYEGAESLNLDPEGHMKITHSAGVISDQTPVSYQFIDGKKQIVESEYMIFEEQSFGFRVGSYARHQELIIDPGLLFSTYLGGNETDGATSITIDQEGYIYVTGVTESANFPTTPGSFDPSGRFDCFITKLTPDSTALVYSTYLGGTTGSDQGNAITVDAEGNAYVTGTTTSRDFPTTPGAFSPTLTGIRNAFVTKLNPAGSSLVYSTYLGGGFFSGINEQGNAIKVDTAGYAYIAGTTSSPTFPTTPGAFQTVYGGSPSDAFVAKMNPFGTALVYSTFLGGNSADFGNDLFLDPSGFVYVVGQTFSNDFPVTPGAYDTNFQMNEVYIAKLDPSGSTLLYSTFLSNGGQNDGNSVTVDSLGQAYITGSTNSAIFPTTPTAFQPNIPGLRAAFVSKINASATSLLYSTFLGGSGTTDGLAVALDIAGNIIVSGTTSSPNFPITENAYSSTFAGNSDVFITSLTPSGSLRYSTYLGGAGPEQGNSVLADPFGNVYVAGATGSPEGLPLSLITNDFNNDGFLDIATANGNTNNVSVLMGNGDGSFQTGRTYSAGDTPFDLAAGDLNNDGFIDLVVTNIGVETISVLFGNGDGTFDSPVPLSTGGSGPAYIVIEDFNNDNIPDLAITNQATSDVSILLGNGDGTFQAPILFPTGTTPTGIAAALFNMDSNIDLATANGDTNDVSILIGNGDGTFQAAVSYGAGLRPTEINAADFNGDGFNDLAVINVVSNDISILLGNGDGTFQAAIHYPVGNFPRGITVGDFNQDGFPDIALSIGATNLINNNLQVLLNNGDGTFQPPAFYAAHNFPQDLNAADYNGDGILDLAAANGNSNDVSILLGNGDGTFQPPANFPITVPFPTTAGALQTAYSGDGDAFVAKLNIAAQPVVNCAGDIVVTNEPGLCGAFVHFDGPSVIDDCPSGFTVTCTPPSGSFFPIGITTVTCEVSNPCGGEAACSFTVTVQDLEPPVILCPNNIIVSSQQGRCGAIVNFPEPSATDCTAVEVTSSPSSGSFFPVGLTTVTSVATDAAGNSSTCTFTITVKDIEPPVISCPANLVVAASPEAEGRIVYYPAAKASDNCSEVTIRYSHPSGSFFPIGRTVVTSTATDEAGNSSTCQFAIIVTSEAEADTPAPFSPSTRPFVPFNIPDEE